MELYIFFSADEHNELIQHFILAEDTEGLARLSFAINKADDLFCNWAIGVGGKPIFHSEGEGIFCVPVDKAGDLPKIREEYCELAGHVSVGVGRSISQAQKACIYARAHGGDRIMLYGPEMDNVDMTGDLSKSESEASDMDLGSSSESDSNVGSQSNSSEEEQTQEGETSANSKDKIKQVVVEVLKQVKDNMQTIEALKEQDPHAYESIRAVIEVMLMMAESFVKDKNEKPLKSKTESLEKAERRNYKKSHGKISRKAKIKYSRKGAKLPIGSMRGGKVKVQFSDGSYKWLSVGAAAKLKTKKAVTDSISKAEDDLVKSIRKLYIRTKKPFGPSKPKKIKSSIIKK